MEDFALSGNTRAREEIIPETNVYSVRKYQKRSDFDPAIVTLIAKGGADFFRYFKSLNLSKESDILVLPSNNHYYYDEEELKDIKILINLKKLNLIKRPDTFLNLLGRILPSNSNLIGCFSDSKSESRNGFHFFNFLEFFRKVISLIDSRTENTLDKNKVLEIFRKSGFRAINMKEMNGLTFFHCKTPGTSYN